MIFFDKILERVIVEVRNPIILPDQVAVVKNLQKYTYDWKKYAVRNATFPDTYNLNCLWFEYDTKFSIV